jgi:AcrR family transcriptional regulator
MLSTKEKIIVGASELFLEKGIYKVTLAQIAAKADISQPGIYNHFEDMEDILIACTNHWISISREDIEKGIHPQATAKTQLLQWVSGNIKSTNNNLKADAHLLGLFYHSTFSEKAKTIFDSIALGATQRLQVFIARGNHEKSWNCKDTEGTSRAIHDLVMGEIIKMIVHPKEFSVVKREAFLFKQIQLLLNF